MLKRHQVLLDDWQVDYLRFVTEVYDVSFSEANRMLICIAAIECTKALYPKFKPSLDIKLMVKKVNMSQPKERNEEVFHKGISMLYFEARKAIEFRMKQYKK